MIRSKTSAPERVSLMSPFTRCTGTRVNGQPCRAPATVDGRWCGQHQPGVTEAVRREWGKRGALVTQRKAIVRQIEESKLPEEEQRRLLNVPDLGNAGKVSRCIEKMVAEVKAGLLPPSLANAINGLLQTKLKVEEMILDRQIVDEIEELERTTQKGPRVIEAPSTEARK